MDNLVEQPNENNENEDIMETEHMADESPQPEQTVADVAEITALQERIEALEKESQTNLDGWQRARAEFTNYKRRTTQELADSKQKGALEAITKFLQVIDDFERAVENIPQELVEDPWVNGTALILKNMEKILDQYNVEPMDPVGEEFDPNQHEAVVMEDSDEYESGVVTATLQKGYRSGDRVLRPALVRVAS